MLVKSIKLSTRCHGSTEYLGQSWPLLLGLSPLRSHQVRYLQQHSTINQVVTTRNGSAPIHQRGAANDARKGSRSIIKKVKQIQKPSNGKSYKSPHVGAHPDGQDPIAPDVSSDHILPNPIDSGYGWTVVGKSGTRYGWSEAGWELSGANPFHFMPFSILTPYERPLLVILASSEGTTQIVADLKKILLAVLKKIYPLQDLKTLTLGVLFAIVDKVSVPANAAELIPSDQVYDGAQGFSFWWTSYEKLKLHPRETERQDKTQGLFTVRINHVSPDSSDSQSPSSIFRIPLANTTFTTGYDYTLRLERIALEKFEQISITNWKSGSRNVEHIKLNEYNVVLEIDSSQTVLSPQAHSDMMGSVLTPWRIAIDVTGNVVKTIQGPDGPLPASSELEKAIAGLAPTEYGRFEVWAKIRPCKAGLQGRDTAQHDRYVKVISGGGGWGEKRGLIALDPGPDIESPANETQDLSEILDFTKLLSNILEPGDELQFIKFPTNRADPGVTESGSSTTTPSRCIQKHGQTTFGFGTTGSSETESFASEPLQPHTHPDTNVLHKQSIFGHFGVMSQRMHYEQVYQSKTPGTSPGSSHSTNLPPFSYIGDSGQFTTRPKRAIIRSRLRPKRSSETEANPETSSKQSSSKKPSAKRSSPSIKSESKTSKVLHLYDPYPLVETSDWAREEELLLTNLKENAPLTDSESEEAIKKQEERVRILFGKPKT